MAVGPINKLPSMVGVTRIPFPLEVGSWNKVRPKRLPTYLSNKSYSPLIGVIVKVCLLTLLLIASLNTPAALTTIRVLKDSEGVQRMKEVSFLTIEVTGVLNLNCTSLA